MKYDEIREVSDKAGFIVKNALLFFNLAEQTRGELGYSTPVFDAVAESLRRAITNGFAGEDIIRARTRYRASQI